MSTKPAPRCPGCGKEMELRWQSYYGGIASMWYACDCGWRSPNGDNENEAYDKAMKRYAENPWISVKDRLPEPGQKVIAVFRDSGGSIADQARYRDDMFDFSGWCNVQMESVTHWMPLPAPPKEGE